jgi:hypothetical protein
MRLCLKMGEFEIEVLVTSLLADFLYPTVGFSELYRLH